MRRLGAIAIVFVAMSGSLAGANAAHTSCFVEGTVRIGGQPLDGVTVGLESGQRRERTATKSDGAFRIDTVRAGDGRLRIEYGTPDGLGMTRMARPIRVEPGAVARADFDLHAGTGMIAGVLSRNGRPTPRGSALLSATLPDGTTLTMCALTGNDGAYRFEGLPAGTHVLRLDARPTMLSVAMARMRKSTFDAPVVLNEGESIRRDYDLSTGEIVAHLKGMRFDEMGRFVVIAGEFAGSKLTADTINILLEQAVAIRVLRNDDTVIVDDLALGTYTAFFAAFDRDSGNVRRAFKTMRLTYAIVSVTANATEPIVLYLE